MITFIADARNVVMFVLAHAANEGQQVRTMERATGFQFRARLLQQPTLARLGDRPHPWAELRLSGASRINYDKLPNFSEKLAWPNWLRAATDIGFGARRLWPAFAVME